MSLTRLRSAVVGGLALGLAASGCDRLLGLDSADPHAGVDAPSGSVRHTLGYEAWRVRREVAATPREFAPGETATWRVLDPDQPAGYRDVAGTLVDDGQTFEAWLESGASAGSTCGGARPTPSA